MMVAYYHEITNADSLIAISAHAGIKFRAWLHVERCTATGWAWTREPCARQSKTTASSFSEPQRLSSSFIFLFTASTSYLMAEILGLVSGSITVAETASAVLKLKRLWNEVRDAPAYIDSLIDQLSLVHPLLTETETELGADEKLLASSSAARLSLNYCKKILWDLDGVAHDLRQQIEDKRRLSRGKTRVKVVLGKETLYALQKRMQDSLQLLGIAQQTYLMWVQNLTIRFSTANRDNRALAKSQPRLVADQIRSLDTTTPLEQENETKTEKGLVRRPAKLRAANNAFTSYTLPWRYSGLFGSYTSHTCGTSDKG
jgi:hypothetical protein